MNFELSTSNKVNDLDKYDESFVKHPINLLKWLTEYLDSLNINILDVVCIKDRITGEEVSFISSKPELDKLYYRNEYPNYVETDSSDFKYVEHPIINPDLIFKLKQGDFIDFQGFNHSTYDGGFIFWDFRFNDMRNESVFTTRPIFKSLEDNPVPGSNIELPPVYQLFLYYLQPYTAADIESIEQMEWVDGVDWVDEFSHRLIKYSLEEYKTVANKPIFSNDLINYKGKEGLDPLSKIYINFKDGHRSAFEVMWNNRTYDYLFGTWSSCF